MRGKSFTLIELIIAMVIVGVLMAIALPRFVSLTTESKTAVTKFGLGALRSTVLIQYANSATGGTALFPAAITTSHFADGKLPKNALNNFAAVRATTRSPGSRPTSLTSGWWYISASGRVGAYSNGTVETSDW
ncbi:MAG: type II secretion system protein [Candidatus Omnitrophota bacterium]